MHARRGRREASIGAAAPPGLNKPAPTKRDRMDVPKIRLYLWPHRLLLLGPAFDTGLHRHHAAQICAGLDGALRLRARSDAPWTEQYGFYIPPDRPHEFAAAVTRTAIIYIEAESAEFSAVKRLQAGADVTSIELPSPTLSQLRLFFNEGATMDQANAACLAMLGLGDDHDPRAERDPRIAQCLSLIRARLAQPLRLGALASAINVSQSWLTHRFRAEVGVPLRRYVLWQRLWRAVEIALRGATLTEAAHAAGLSDSAHLSRTFREMFGVTPSFLFEHRNLLDVHFAD